MFERIVFKFILKVSCITFYLFIAYIYLQRDIKDVGKAVKYLLFRAEFILILIKEISLVLITLNHCCSSRIAIIFSVWVY